MEEFVTEYLLLSFPVTFFFTVPTYIPNTKNFFTVFNTIFTNFTNACIFQFYFLFLNNRFH